MQRRKPSWRFMMCPLTLSLSFIYPQKHIIIYMYDGRHSLCTEPVGQYRWNGKQHTIPTRNEGSSRQHGWSYFIYKCTSVKFHFSRYEAGCQENIEFQMVARQPFWVFAILSDKHQKLRMSCGKFEFSMP